MDVSVFVLQFSIVIILDTETGSFIYCYQSINGLQILFCYKQNNFDHILWPNFPQNIGKIELMLNYWWTDSVEKSSIDNCNSSSTFIIDASTHKPSLFNLCLNSQLASEWSTICDQRIEFQHWYIKIMTKSSSFQFKNYFFIYNV